MFIANLHVHIDWLWAQIVSKSVQQIMSSASRVTIWRDYV